MLTSRSLSDLDPVLEAVELVPATDGFLPTKSEGVAGLGPIIVVSPGFNLSFLIATYVKLR